MSARIALARFTHSGKDKGTAYLVFLEHGVRNTEYATRIMNRWHGLFVAILLFGLPWLWWTRVPVDAQQAARTPQPALNYPLPPFDLLGLAEGSLSTAELHGRPLVINFWATWCAPCREEMPMLQAAWQRYGDRVTLLGVDVGETPAQVAPFVAELGITFPIALDQDRSVSTTYNVRGLPTTFFVDSDGVIRYIYPGQLNSAIFAEGLERILP